MPLAQAPTFQHLTSVSHPPPSTHPLLPTLFPPTHTSTIPCPAGALTPAINWYRANHHPADIAATLMRRRASPAASGPPFAPSRTSPPLAHHPGALTPALNWYRANHHPAAIAATRMRRSASPAAMLNMPVMGIWPARDGVLSEAQMTASSCFVAYPSLWRYERVANSGHWLQRDDTGTLNALLLDFLGKLPGRCPVGRQQLPGSCPELHSAGAQAGGCVQACEGSDGCSGGRGPLAEQNVGHGSGISNQRSRL